MFSRNNERQSANDRLVRDDQRVGALSALPPAGMRDAVAMPIAPEPAAQAGAESIVGKEDRIEGTLRVKRGLRVLGHVEGQIEAATSVTIEAGATVQADLTADEAIIAGEYSGKLICRQRLEIRATGRVKGEIETVRLMLHEGGFIDGALHMQRPASEGSAEPGRGESLRGGDGPRSSDALRAGVSPRSTADAVTETSSIEVERETASAGGRTSSTGSARPASR